MINLIIDDTVVPHNASFTLNESLQWVRPKNLIRGFTGNLIWASPNTANMIQLDISLDGWVPAFLSSYAVGDVVIVSPSVPLTYTQDKQLVLLQPAVKRPFTVYNPAKADVTDLTLEIRNGEAAQAWEHTKNYGNNLPDLQGSYTICYITFQGVITENSITATRDGYSQKISIQSTTPIKASNAV